VASIGALRGNAFIASYSASKAALTLLSRTAAQEFAALSYPVRVNVLHPGGSIDSAMMESAYAQMVEQGLATSVAKQRAEVDSPLRRAGRPEEVAGGVVFLCSPAASFTTGSELIIDGGVMA
jgi:NAD(P)-dependent dehydrogenase (short-subunit alcohol dehydrogenase family)